MPKLKPGHISPTDEEEAAIQAGIAADPDTFRTGRGVVWADCQNSPWKSILNGIAQAAAFIHEN